MEFLLQISTRSAFVSWAARPSNLLTPVFLFKKNVVQGFWIGTSCLRKSTVNGYGAASFINSTTIFMKYIFKLKNPIIDACLYGK